MSREAWRETSWGGWLKFLTSVSVVVLTFGLQWSFGVRPFNITLLCIAAGIIAYGATTVAQFISKLINLPPQQRREAQSQIELLKKRLRAATERDWPRLNSEKKRMIAEDVRGVVAFPYVSIFTDGASDCRILGADLYEALSDGGLSIPMLPTTYGRTLPSGIAIQFREDQRGRAVAIQAALKRATDIDARLQPTADSTLKIVIGCRV